MYRPVQSALITIAATAAFLAGASGIADAGDPEESAEAPPPGPAPAIAIWNSEVRTADIDGLRFSLEGSTLSLEYLPNGARNFDYDVRCEVAAGNPMSRMYIPPQLVFEKRIEGRLGANERMTVALDLLARDAEGEALVLGAMYDTLRVSIRPRGAAPQVAPTALLQVPRT